MKNRKRIISILLMTALAIISLSGCGRRGEGFDASKNIHVTSREEGSGTRGAFIELFGIEQMDEKGEKVDYTTPTAVTTNSTSVMMTTIAGDIYAIGYISLGSLNDTVRAVEIDGAMPSVENIKNGTYKAARPFNIVTADSVSENTQDFIEFIMSADGQTVIEEAGYISVSDAPGYTGGMTAGKVIISGSSSITSVMEKLKEAYQKLNPDVIIEVQQSDSSTGITDTADGTCDIGMASRELKASEVEKGLRSTVIALDGIVVIVNNDCAVNAFTSEQIMKIFIGEATTWDKVIA